MTNRLRNIFHQYSKPENRVTHALAHALVSNGSLTGSFLHWATGCKPVGKVAIVVQDHLEMEESIPDLTLKVESEYVCAVENKVVPGSVRQDQLASHWRRVSRAGTQTGSVLVITPDADEPDEVRNIRETGAVVYWRAWPEVYQWMRDRSTRRPDAVLTRAFCEYLRQVESDLQKERNDVMLTAFDGIQFEEGKRDDSQARSLLSHMRNHIESSDAMRSLFPGLNHELGRKQSGYWTSIGLVFPTGAQERGDPFNKHPHLTIGFEEDQFSAFIVLPHAARPVYKRRAKEASLDAWQRIFTDILRAVHGLEAPKPVPYVLIKQRHWITRRGPPIVDGSVEFTLDTVASSIKVDSEVKENEKWVSIVPSLVKTSGQANIELRVGLHYPYMACQEVLQQPAFPSHLVQAIRTLQPFFRLLTEESRGDLKNPDLV